MVLQNFSTMHRIILDHLSLESVTWWQKKILEWSKLDYNDTIVLDFVGYRENSLSPQSECEFIQEQIENCHKLFELSQKIKNLPCLILFCSQCSCFDWGWIFAMACNHRLFLNGNDLAGRTNSSIDSSQTVDIQRVSDRHESGLISFLGPEMLDDLWLKEWVRATHPAKPSRAERQHLDSYLHDIEEQFDKHKIDNQAIDLHDYMISRKNLPWAFPIPPKKSPDLLVSTAAIIIKGDGAFPQDVIIKMLQACKLVCLISRDIKALPDQLKDLQKKMEKKLTSHNFKQLWSQRVTWGVGARHCDVNLVWNSCDDFEISDRSTNSKKNHRFILLRSIDDKHDNSAEHVGTALDWNEVTWEVSAILDCCFNREYLWSIDLEIPLPAAVLVRYLVLNELYRLCTVAGYDFPTLCRQLRKEGWPVFGDTSFWKRFIVEHGTLAYEKALASKVLTSSGLAERCSEPPKSKEKAPKLLVGQNLSMHLAGFSRVITDICRQIGVQNGLESDDICRFIGICGGYGSSKELVKMAKLFGLRRFDRYAAQHWPEFKRQAHQNPPDPQQ